MLIFLAIPEDAVLQDVKMTSTPTYIPPTETIVGFTAVLLGLGDSGFNTQIMGILGLLYKVSFHNQAEPQFYKTGVRLSNGHLARIPHGAV